MITLTKMVSNHFQRMTVMRNTTPVNRNSNGTTPITTMIWTTVNSVQSAQSVLNIFYRTYFFTIFRRNAAIESIRQNQSEPRKCDHKQPWLQKVDFSATWRSFVGVYNNQSSVDILAFSTMFLLQVCESIHTSQLSLFKPNNRKRFSVHNRLNKNFVSPAVTARKNIVINALKSAESAVQALCDPSDSYYTGNEFLSLVANTNIKQEPKYNMKIQKEISQLQVNFKFSDWPCCIDTSKMHFFIIFQGKQLAFTRGPPGLNVVSTDGKQKWESFSFIASNSFIYCWFFRCRCRHCWFW